MKKLLFIISIFILIVGCEKDAHIVAIAIKNDTGGNIKCRFYPKKPEKGVKYEVEIIKGLIDEICNTNNLDLTPGGLLSISLDSFTLKSSTYSKTIAFKKGEVRNYKTNPYNEDFPWEIVKSTSSSSSSNGTNYYYPETYIMSINLQDTL